jgi:hypothetical protein
VPGIDAQNVITSVERSGRSNSVRATPGAWDHPPESKVTRAYAARDPAATANHRLNPSNGAWANAVREMRTRHTITAMYADAPGYIPPEWNAKYRMSPAGRASAATIDTRLAASIDE